MKRYALSYGIRIIVTVFFCLFIAVLCAENSAKPVEAVSKLLKNEMDFPQMAKSVSASYLSDEFWGKDSFININGLFARLSGRHEYNHVLLLKNGMLGSGRQSPADSKLPETLPAFSRFVESIGGEFLYVVTPYKMDMQHELLPVSFPEYQNACADSVLERLAEAGVQTLDLRRILTETPEQLEKYFYRTDHHWSPDGAFVAFQEIMQYCKDHARSETDVRYTNPDLWERHVLDNWFLGSLGKRVGSLYAGTDPLIWYTPVFETNMSCIIPHRGELFRGSFEDTNIKDRFIKERDLFHKNAYCVYLGGDYPLVLHRNMNAPNKEKILIIKDSFVLPLQAFFSTEFAEIDVIDPRYYSDSSIVEYCAWRKPDRVIMVNNVSALGNAAYAEFGTAVEYGGEEIILRLSDVTIVPSDNHDNHHALPFEPEKGKAYSFSFESVSALEGSPEGVSVLLYDVANQETVLQYFFPMDCCDFPGGNQCFFKVPSDGPENADYRLLIDAEISGKTANIGLSCSGICVAELLYKDSGSSN